MERREDNTKEIEERIKNEKNKKKTTMILVIILFILSGVFFILGNRLGKIDVTGGEKSDSQAINTVLGDNSNIDNNDVVFEIEKENIDVNKKIDNSIIDITNNNTNENISEKEPEDFFVKSENKIWEETKELKIFNLAKYNYEAIVAPEDKGEYEFIVRNKLQINIEYGVKFATENLNGMNLKYRLKKNGNYIKGNKNTYVNLEDLDLEKILISSNKEDIYKIEWYWKEQVPEIDNLIAGVARYKLFVKVDAEEKI